MFECRFFRFETEQIEHWQSVYWNVNVRDELVLMREWLEVHPRRRKKDYPRFANRWLKEEYRKALQDKPRAGFSIVATLAPESLERLRARRGMR